MKRGTFSFKQELLHFISAIGYSCCGLKDASNEIAFRQLVFLGVLHYILIFVLDIAFAFKLILAAFLPIVLVSELINSAVEQIVDHISPEWNDFAKHAKDYCSAATGLLVITLLGLWIAALIQRYI